METEGPALSILQVLEKGSFTTGSVVQMFELARGLARRGHRVAVVSRPDGDVGDRCRAEGIPFFAFRFRHEFDLASARGLARLFEERSVDVVHVHKGIAHSAALFAERTASWHPVIALTRPRCHVDRPRRGTYLASGGRGRPGLGAFVSVLLGCGLMALMFFSNRHGYDEAADPFRKRRPKA